MGTKLQDGRFTVGRVLGRGGFGITYKGADTQLRRPVAVKELFPEFATRTRRSVTVTIDRQASFQSERESVVREARALAGLRAPGVVNVHDCFDENGTVYIVMEYLEGPTLEAEIARRGRLPPADAVRVAAQVCEALEAVHGAGFLHRDVKPANIVLAGDSRAVLIDFGSARSYASDRTQRHTVVVTPDYAAPEQFGPVGRFGPATDLFALGATLHHALTGAPPEPALARLQRGDAPLPVPPEAPEGLGRALQASLYCQVKQRPQSAAEFMDLFRTVDEPLDLYSFRGRQYEKPEDLVTVLSDDWDSAIDEWNKGELPKWLTRKLDSNFEQIVERMEADPLFMLATSETAAARSIQVGQTQSGKVGHRGKDDLFKVSLQADTIYRIEVCCKRRFSFYYRLNLLHPSGIKVKHSDMYYSKEGPVCIEYAPADSGDYIIEVQGSEDDEGSYRLSVQSLSQTETIGRRHDFADMRKILPIASKLQ